MYSKKLMALFRNPKNIGKIKGADGIGRVGNPVCLIPETKIHSNPDILPISSIKIGSMVLSHDGKYHKVTGVIKRKYKGKLIKIKNRLGTSILTPEHEILSIKIPKKRYYLYTRNKKKKRHYWYHVEDLEKGDFTLYSIMKENKDTKRIFVENRKIKFDYKSKKIPKNIPIDRNFLRLSGYFLAEGHLKEEVTKAHISFTFGISEEKYANDVVSLIKNIFGLEAKKRIVQNHNTVVINVNSVMVVRLFKKLFGKGAENKRIPDFMMFLEPKKQKELIKGLWRGDGYFSTDRKWPRAGYSTISYELCQQIKILLMRQGIIPSIYEEKEKIIRGVKHRKSYRIHVGNRKSMEKLAEILDIGYTINLDERNDAWCDDDYIYIPITSIYKIDYDGYVFNLEIDESKSFASDSLLVHNCGDVMHFYIKVSNNKIVDAKYETFGCVAAIGTSEVVTKMIKGKTVEQAEKITKDDVAKAVGGLPPLKLHCSVLAIDALKDAIKNYKIKNQ